MHKRILNEFDLDFIIKPVGPLLIKSGWESGADPTLPAMNFVRTVHAELGRTIYLPGSSLKGVIRSHAERILRTLRLDCCDPFQKDVTRADVACDRRPDLEIQKRKERNKQLPEDQKLRVELTSAEEYGLLCTACRLFGHTVQASHFAISDAYPSQAMDTLPVRHGIAIDRRSGGVVGGALFEMEVATGGEFAANLAIHNFERWQIGLLALVLRDIELGRLPIGFGKSRGLGRARLRYRRLTVAYPGHFAADGFDFEKKLYGVGAFPSLETEYGFVSGDEGDLPEPRKIKDEDWDWGRPTVIFGYAGDGLSQMSSEQIKTAHEEVKAVLSSTVPAWKIYCERKGGSR